MALSYERVDHGTEFGGNRIQENGNQNSRFKNHLEELGIKPIMARVKHPQTNGKLESGSILTGDSERISTCLERLSNGTTIDLTEA